MSPDAFKPYTKCLSPMPGSVYTKAFVVRIAYLLRLVVFLYRYTQVDDFSCQT